MNNVQDNFRKSLLKRQEALEKYKAKREAFLLAKALILKDIEEAGNIWKNTFSQIPDSGFNL
ncbi:MAG: hypothetical protein WCR72_17655 [Bacteroidota bacterium]